MSLQDTIEEYEVLQQVQDTLGAKIDIVHIGEVYADMITTEGLLEVFGKLQENNNELT